MWSEVEREVNNSLITPWPPSRPWSQMWWPNLTGMSSFMYARGSGLVLRLIWRPPGFLSNKCTWYMNINFSWKFHQKVLTLTIYFMVLNDSIEFVLIYRPHPVASPTDGSLSIACDNVQQAMLLKCYWKLESMYLRSFLCRCALYIKIFHYLGDYWKIPQFLLLKELVPF